MKIKPSERPKKRYIVFEVLSTNIDDDSTICNAIKKSAFNVLGPKYQQAGIRFLKDKYKHNIHRGIVRVNNKYANTLIESINKSRHLKTVGMSGILKKAENKFLKIAS